MKADVSPLAPAFNQRVLLLMNRSPIRRRRRPAVTRRHFLTATLRMVIDNRSRAPEAPNRLPALSLIL